MFEQILGKKAQSISLQEVEEKAAAYKSVHIDFGTGDGLFAWRLARENPETFVIGIDAAKDSLAEASARAIKKPARGGAPNAIFLCANVLELPDEMKNLAETLSVNFPWGSLLQAVALPDEKFLAKLFEVGKSEAALNIYLNEHVFEDPQMRHSLGLPELTDEYIETQLLPKYAAAGWGDATFERFRQGQKTGVKSTWGGRLERNSNRPTSCLTFRKIAGEFPHG